MVAIIIPTFQKPVAVARASRVASYRRSKFREAKVGRRRWDWTVDDSLRAVRIVILALGLALPSLVLVPLGTLWLWERGWLIYWALAVVLTTALSYLIQKKIFGPSQPAADEAIAASDIETSSSGEAAAQMLVKRRASAVSADAVSSWDNAIKEAGATVTGVAIAFHPDVKEPLLKFTLPEALLLVEQTAARLRPVVQNTIPLGSRLTVGQIVGLYRWRTVADMAGQAWDIWRIIRVINPASAAAQEMRERLSRHLIQWGKDAFLRRLAQALVTQAGAAAIELYSGRMRVPVQAAADTGAAQASSADSGFNR